MNKKEKDVSACQPCCPPVEPRLPYDEISHEVGKNVLTVRVAKNVGRIQNVYPPDGPVSSSLAADCEDTEGNKCCSGCTKVNVIPNKAPPAKLPNEEMFLMRASRRILNAEKMKNSLEIEFRTPRNYEPLVCEQATQPIAKDEPAK
ncbi:uncharacterized protein LOC131672298 [Phymastichus coffea]|uniref:uncharacterized protein LOC131672298 n=1 Tax=Phymastichus coffea TaxID=108790 RepID=UPI00273C6F9B|nr:uncharacterized protein LOC131672298 [Phymastichus coffea]